MGDDALKTSGDEIRINAECVFCDVWYLESAASRGDSAEVDRLYPGPLLDGFVSESPEFDRWVNGERIRFAHMHAQALEYLAPACAQAGDSEPDAKAPDLADLAESEPTANTVSAVTGLEVDKSRTP